MGVADTLGVVGGNKWAVNNDIYLYIRGGMWEEISIERMTSVTIDGQWGHMYLFAKQNSKNCPLRQGFTWDLRAFLTFKGLLD